MKGKEKTIIWKHDENRFLEQEKIVKKCIRNYYKKDKNVMIDASVMRIKGIMFYIYDLIYFGNKIIISKESLEIVESYKVRITSRLFSNNSSYLLDNIKNDKYENYNIIDIQEYGENTIKRISNYLKENKDIVYVLENKRLYDILRREGLEKRLKLLNLRSKISSACKNHVGVKFETIGMIKHNNEKMFVTKRLDETIVKVYHSSGKEKEGNKIEVKIGDLILIRSEKNTKYCFNLYLIVSRHTRHQAIRIIWTDIIKGDKTNFYIERLEEKYKTIIKQNTEPFKN